MRQPRAVPFPCAEAEPEWGDAPMARCQSRRRMIWRACLTATCRQGLPNNSLANSPPDLFMRSQHLCRSVSAQRGAAERKHPTSVSGCARTCLRATSQHELLLCPHAPYWTGVYRTGRRPCRLASSFACPPLRHSRLLTLGCRRPSEAYVFHDTLICPAIARL